MPLPIGGPIRPIKDEPSGIATLNDLGRIAIEAGPPTIDREQRVFPSGPVTQVTGAPSDNEADSRFG